MHPNLSEEPRVSISYNVVLKWSDDYLPTQGLKPIGHTSVREPFRV